MKASGIWSWFLVVITTHWKQAIPIFLATIVSAVVSVGFPLVWQIVFDQMIAGINNPLMITLFALLFLGHITPLVRPFRSKLLNAYERDITCLLFRHVLRLSIPFHKEKESAKIVVEAGKGVGAGINLLDAILHGAFLVDAPVAVFSLCYVATYSLGAAGILVAFMAIFLAVNYKLGTKIAKLHEDHNELDNELSVRQRETLQHIETVRLHQAEGYEALWTEKQARARHELGLRLNRYKTLFDCFSGLSRALPFGISLLVFVPDVVDKTMTVGTLIALQLFSIRAIMPIGFLADMYHNFKNNSAKLKPVLDLLQQEPTVAESPHPVDMSPVRHEVRVSNLTFSYPGAEAPTLSDISLCIKAGEKVAVVGKTGSGKSTLARLLVRFYDPDHGVITMDGTDVRHLSFSSLYQQVSYVTQEVPIFSGTIGENICYGQQIGCIDRIAEAIKHASLDFVFGCENGLDTKVGELGEKLSGGERQRLALARIFMRNPSLIILDEATSSLDAATEEIVQRSFDELLQKGVLATMVVIAHRISTVKNADRIIVLDRGRIVDIGNHKELLSRCELYRELCRAPIDYALAT